MSNSELRSDEIAEAFEDIMYALGRIHPGDRSKRIQRCMEVYDRMHPGAYDDHPGWTYIQHSLDDRMPEYTATKVVP